MDEQKQLIEIAEHFSMVYGRQFNPKVSKSTKRKRWYAFITPQTCTPCLDKNETLFNEEHPLDTSNDGLLFITYDHYTTFFEITMED